MLHPQQATCRRCPCPLPACCRWTTPPLATWRQWRQASRRHCCRSRRRQTWAVAAQQRHLPAAARCAPSIFQSHRASLLRHAAMRVMHCSCPCSRLLSQSFFPPARHTAAAGGGACTAPSARWQQGAGRAPPAGPDTTEDRSCAGGAGSGTGSQGSSSQCSSSSARVPARGVKHRHTSSICCRGATAS